MAYFGCSTWPNRGRWLLVVAFCGLAIVLIALHTHETSQCVKCSEVDGVEVCEDYKQGEDTDWSGTTPQPPPARATLNEAIPKPHPTSVKPSHTSDTHNHISSVASRPTVQDSNPRDFA